MEGVGKGLDPLLAERLAARLDEDRLDGLLIVAESSGDPDLAPFVGSAHLGESFLLISRGGEPALGFLTDMERDEAQSTGFRLLGPDDLGVRALQLSGARPGDLWHSVLAAALERLNVPPGRFALAGHPSAGTIVEACAHLSRQGWSWQSGIEVLRRWRKFKPAGWRERIERPAAGVCAAMWAIARLLARATPGPDGLVEGGVPLRIGRLREAAREEFSRRGLSEPEGNIMAAGASGGVPHTRGDSSHVLQPGEPLVVDLFPRGEVFADCTRTFCVGEPPGGFSAAFACVRSALEQAHASALPGVRGWDLQLATCRLLEEAGYATLRSDPTTQVGYVHGLGHGVGYELHEYPSFREVAGEEGVLEVGDLLTLEPGLYDSAAGFGVRLEDLCYLGSNGLENLTPLPLEWDPGLWSERATAGA